MRGGLALAGVLTVGLLGLLIAASHESCGTTYHIDAAGNLVTRDEGRTTFVSWHTEMPEFEDAPVQPGDQLSYKTTTTGWGEWKLKQSRLDITRAGAPPVVIRSGVALYWLGVVGIAGLPMFLWLVAFGLSRSATRAPPPGL